ncbi:hypothetical protein OH77DRAFT_989499 [Trametes cingulata]|nr:hypothetical protein OH77DRAFT_989499 [Trametes cingulata]
MIPLPSLIPSSLNCDPSSLGAPPAASSHFRSSRRLSRTLIRSGFPHGRGAHSLFIMISHGISTQRHDSSSSLPATSFLSRLGFPVFLRVRHSSSIHVAFPHTSTSIPTQPTPRHRHPPHRASVRLCKLCPSASPTVPGCFTFPPSPNSSLSSTLRLRATRAARDRIAGGVVDAGRKEGWEGSCSDSRWRSWRPGHLRRRRLPWPDGSIFLLLDRRSVQFPSCSLYPS